MKFNWKIPAVALGTFAVLYGGTMVYDHYKVDDTPSLCLLAGEGFVLTSGRDMVLMDALWREGFPEDKLVSDELMTQIENAEGDFAHVDLVTVSHRHVDHFGVESLLAFMANNPAARVLMPPEASSEFFEAGGNGYADRVFSIYPPRGAPQSLEINGISVTVYNLDHRTEVENIGVLFEFADKTFFHMGDFAAADFEENGIKGLKVDYLLAPYWYFRNAENFALLEDNMEAAYYVPMHMPKPDLPEDFAARVGSFDDLFEAVSTRADNVLMLYEEGSCLRPDK